MLGPAIATAVRLWQPGYVLPVLDTASLTTMLTGLLGLAGARTWEKIQGVASASTETNAPAIEVRRATAVR